MFNPQIAEAPQTRCRLQLFTAPGMRPVAVATQTMSESAATGAGLINDAERFASGVWAQHFPDDLEPPLWIEIFLSDGILSCKPVTFTVLDRHRLRDPSWGEHLNAEQLSQLVGMTVDRERGPHTEPPLPAEPELHLQIAQVQDLPRAEVEGDRGCWTAALTQEQVLHRQQHPLRGPLPCIDPVNCWYHQGDWHIVCSVAVDLLQQAQDQHIPPSQMVSYLAERAGHVLQGWELQALGSLLYWPIDPHDDGDTFANGRHRSHAMQEAGVPRTITASRRMLA